MQKLEVLTIITSPEEGVKLTIRTEYEDTDTVNFDRHIEKLGAAERKVNTILKANRDLENETGI